MTAKVITSCENKARVIGRDKQGYELEMSRVIIKTECCNPARFGPNFTSKSTENDISTR